MLLGVCALLASDSAIERILPVAKKQHCLLGLVLQSTYQSKMPSGLVTVRLASILIRLGQRRMGCFALLVAGRGGGRMDLLIAVMQRAAILNVGGQTVHNRWR